MNILLYMLGGAGDVINTTGVISQLKAQHFDFNITFMCYKKHEYLVKDHPAINKIIFSEDFNLSKLPEPDAADNFISTIPGYDKIINMWSKKYQGDFPLSKIKILLDMNIQLTIQRSDINGVLFPRNEDYIIVDEFYEKYLSSYTDKKIVLIEDNSYNATQFNNINQTKQISYQKDICENLLKKDFIIISNEFLNTVSCSNLNLLQIKILFQEYCDIFLGLSSGMTTVFFTEGNYKNKMFIISGRPEWNYCKHINSMEKYAYYKNYTWETLNADFRIFDRSTKCCELENVECARSAL